MLKLILTLITCSFLLSSCGTTNDNLYANENVEISVPEEKIYEKYSTSTFAFDTVVDITIYSTDKNEATEILKRAEELCFYYDDLLNKSKDDSLVSILNKNKYYELSETKEDDILLKLIEKSLWYSEVTHGYFDITIEPLVDLWGIGNGNKHAPSSDDIENLLQNIDYNNIIITDNSITLGENTTIDLGAIAKGFIADELKLFLLEQNIEHGLINLGGNVLTINNKPDGSNYVVGIREPFENATDLMGIVSVEDKSVVTSGVYERYFEENGNLYHHILDPYTGYPSNNELLAVSIISDDSIDGDAFSTSTFLLGLEEGLKLINSIDGVEAMFITSDNEYFFSNNFVEDYNFKLYN